MILCRDEMLLNNNVLLVDYPMVLTYKHNPQRQNNLQQPIYSLLDRLIIDD